MEWHHPEFPWKKKCKRFPSVGKVLVTVFSDCEVVILVDVMQRGETTVKLTSGCSKNSRSISN
jgi:hypothetical protein